MVVVRDEIEDLSPEELQELASRLSSMGLPEVASGFLSGAPRPIDLPLSFGQERLWFLEQLESLGAAYNLGEAIELVGSLDVDALERSWRELVRRHESLRTHFESMDGRGVQRIRDSGDFRLERPDPASLLNGSVERQEWIRLRAGTAARSLERRVSGWAGQRGCPGACAAGDHASHDFGRVVAAGCVEVRVECAVRSLPEKESARHWRRWRCSTRTTRCGNGSGCKGRCWSGS